MADIKNIDYDAMIMSASSISAKANEMQNRIKEAFEIVTNMRDNWFGSSYDNFINIVNMAIPALNGLFETTVSDIPHEIAAKARSYAASNQSEVSSSLSENVVVILSELSKTNAGSKLRFQTEEVRGKANLISSKFSEAKDQANSASRIAQNLEADWNSISGGSNIRLLVESFNKVISIIERLSQSLQDQITAQQDTIETIENAANTVEAAQKVASDAIDSTVDAATGAVNAIKSSAEQLWKNLTGKN